MYQDLAECHAFFGSYSARLLGTSKSCVLRTDAAKLDFPYKCIRYHAGPALIIYSDGMARMSLCTFEITITKIAFHDILEARSLIVLARSKTSYSYKVIEDRAYMRFIYNYRFCLTLDDPLWTLEFRLVSKDSLLFAYVCDKFPIVKLFGFGATVSFYQINCSKLRLIKRELHLAVSSPFKLGLASFICFEYVSEYFTQNWQLRLDYNLYNTVEWVVGGFFPEQGIIYLGVVRNDSFLQLFRERCRMQDNFVVQRNCLAYSNGIRDLVELMEQDASLQAFKDLAANWPLQHDVWRYSVKHSRTYLKAADGPACIPNRLSFIILSDYLRDLARYDQYHNAFLAEQPDCLSYRILDITVAGYAVPFIAGADLNQPDCAICSALQRNVLNAYCIDVIADGCRRAISFPKLFEMAGQVCELKAGAFVLRVLMLNSYIKLHYARYYTFTITFASAPLSYQLDGYVQYFRGLRLSFFDRISIHQEGQSVIFSKRCHKSQIAAYKDVVRASSLKQALSDIETCVYELQRKLQIQMSATEAFILRQAFVRVCGFYHANRCYFGAKPACKGIRASKSTLEPLKAEYSYENVSKRLWRAQTLGGGEVELALK